MRIIHAVAVVGALVLGAAAAQAESPEQLLYGQTQYPASTMYSQAYGQQVTPLPSTAFDPNETIGGTTVNASNIDNYQEVHEGRAATVGAPPAPPVRPR